MPPRAHHHRLSQKEDRVDTRTLVGWIFAFIWLMALPVWAAEYRLQVTNIGFLNFSSYMGKATPVVGPE
jgi:hypothetical protein